MPVFAIAHFADLRLRLATVTGAKLALIAVCGRRVALEKPADFPETGEIEVFVAGRDTAGHPEIVDAYRIDIHAGDYA
ncbi:MAG: hypothetical protein ING19_17200 [Azospirillum sp.]|nr:hypothetical protein [Azospirillum sp.]